MLKKYLLETCIINMPLKVYNYTFHLKKMTQIKEINCNSVHNATLQIDIQNKQISTTNLEICNYCFFLVWQHYSLEIFFPFCKSETSRWLRSKKLLRRSVPSKSSPTVVWTSTSCWTCPTTSWLN